MKAMLILLMAASLLAAPAAFAADEYWLHVYVQENGDEGDKVRVNLPFSLIEAVLPLIEEEEFHGGKIRIDHEDFDSRDLYKIVKAVRGATDGEYVQVEGIDENVRVAKKGDYMTVSVVEENGEGRDPSTVDIRVHMDVLDAMISGDEDEIDVLAAVQALAKHGGGEFVVVNDEDESVRVWVDQKSSSD